MRPTPKSLEDLERHAGIVRSAVRDYNVAVLQARRAGLEVRAVLKKPHVIEQQILQAEIALPFGQPQDDVDEVINEENAAGWAGRES